MSTKLEASNLTYFSGEDISIPVTVTDDDDAAVDMTGASVRFDIARSTGAPPVISSAADPATATITIASSVVTIDVDDADTDTREAQNTPKK